MEKDKIVQTAQAKKDKLEKLCRALQTERTELLAGLKQLRGSDIAEENGEHKLYDEDKVLDDQKCGSPDHLEEIHDGTLNDGMDMSHDSEAASHDPHEDDSHDPHEDGSHDLHEDGSHDSREDGSHDLLVEQTSPSSDVTANQNEVDITD